MEHIENITEIRAAVKHILFEEYHLESVNDIFDLDGETLAEMYEQFKCVMEEVWMVKTWRVFLTGLMADLMKLAS
ncbi:hypothetical protein [Escherichia albertii]|uniref:hypothetical protein n=1 Tax=Escherichia albertii TaxID=208962 RepID=UPI001FCA382D|nr:hypothetical protein [Escherichia albertii]